MIFGFAILATAVLLSAVAAYYSVAGLTAIFSAATIPVIIMGGSLELGKIVATVWLHNNWRRAPFLFKAYLVPAVAFLMLLTSMGIFGYLSKAHSDQSLVSGDSMAQVAIYDEKIKIERENIDANRKALKQFDEAVDQVMGRSTDEKGADKAVAIRRSQQKERVRLQSEIAESQKRITTLNEQRAPLAAEFRKVEAEVGPIKYIAALVYGDNPDANILEKAVRLVIIMIVLVFDPLALTLILAANKQFEWAIHGTGGWVHDEDNTPVPKSAPTAPAPEPELSFLDQHPYLKTPFKHFENLKPMVGTLVPKPEIYSGNPEDFKDPWPEEDKAKLVDAMQGFFDQNKKDAEPDLHVYDDERLVTPHDKKILAMGVDVVDRPGDYVTPPDLEESPEVQDAMRRWKSENPNDTLKHQRNLLDRGLIAELPWMKLVEGNESKSGFGIEFPKTPSRGDTFVRVDRFPNIVYKYNGHEWMQVDKNLTDSYTYDSAYIDHLIEKISSGEYDPELLNESEREQVAQRLQQNNTNT